MTHETDQRGPRVSVIIPTYNGERFLREALESVYAQTLLPCEIVIVDDRSTDGSALLAQSLVTQSPVPLRVVRLTKNSGGPASPINAGIAQARGEFISVLDQDDVFAPDHLAAKATILAARPDIAVAIGWCGQYGDSSGEPRQNQRLRGAIVQDSLAHHGFHEVAGHHVLSLNVRWGMLFVGYPAFVFRRSDWLRKGGVDESLRIASDLEFLGWLLMQGVCAVVPQVGYFRREHDANVSHRRPDVYLEVALVRMRLLTQSSHLRRNSQLIAGLRKELLETAYWFEEGACYGHARKFYWLAHRLGRRRAKTAISLVKLQFTRLYRWITRRPPVPSRFTSPECPSILAKNASSDKRSQAA